MRSVIASALVLGSTLSAPLPASAAGEVITVDPPVAVPGQEVVITISNIASSSFCDFMPYAGDGYTSTAYIQNLEGDYHFFPAESEPFDPKNDESITYSVRIPANWPTGNSSVTGDCWTPDGIQTGNTAKRFILEVVSELPEPDPSSEQAAAEDAEPEAEQPASSNASVSAARGEPISPSTLAFLPRRAMDSAEYLVFLQGREIDWEGGVSITLSGRGERWELSELTAPLDEPVQVDIPRGLADGSYTLRASGRSTHTDRTEAINETLTVADGTYTFGSEELPITPTGSLPTWVWLLSGSVSAAGIALGAAAIILGRRRKAQLS